MESTDKLKEIDIKNRTCYCFDDIITDRDIYSVDLLFDKKPYETYKNILIYDISYKTSTSAKPLCIRLDQIDGFIKVLDRIKYLVLFNYGYFHKLCDRIKYFIIEKSGITDSINHNSGKIRIY